MNYSIAITGSFGSGKSLVGDILSKSGVCVIDTDHVAAKILSVENKITEKLVAVFGRSIINKSPKDFINKKRLAAIVFTNPRFRKKLESIIHPEIRKIVKNKISKIKGSKIIAVLIPLLFESKQDKYYDEIWCVVCRNNVRIGRLKQKGFSQKEIKLRLKAQLPEKKKIERSDFVIDNSGKKSSTEKQVVFRLKQLVQSNHSLRLSSCK